MTFSKLKCATHIAAYFLFAILYDPKIQAQAPEPVWQYSTYENKYSSGEILRTKVEGLPGNVSFSCSKFGLATTISLAPVDFSDMSEMRVVRRETRRVKLFINNVKSKTTRWHYPDGIKSVSATDNKTKADLYNAAIRGDVVTLKFKKDDAVTLFLPKPNEAFAKFGAACGLG